MKKRLKRCLGYTCLVKGLFTLYLVFFSLGFSSGHAPTAKFQNWAGHYLLLDGSKIYYEEAGSGENMVLIHDGLLSSVTWDNEWNILNKRFHVVRYDRRGYGQSDEPAKPFAQWDDLYLLLKHLNISHTTIVGCSSGGGIAIDFTLMHPEMVDRLILLGSVLHGMPVTNAFLERGAKNNNPLGNGDIKAAARNWADDPFTILPSDTAGRKELYEGLIKYPQNLKYTGDYDMRLPVPAVRRLSEIHVPTLIMVGEGDIPDVQAFDGAIQAGIPGARREIIKGSAHLIPLDVPVFLCNRIVKFVEGYPSVKVSEDILQKYVGQYKLWDEPVSVLLKGGSLWLQVPEECDIPLFPLSDSKFKLFLWTQDGELEFVQDAKGKIIEVKIIGEDNSINKGPRL